MPDIPVDQPLSDYINHQDKQNQSRSSSVSHLHGDPLSGEDIKMDGHGPDGREERSGHH
jgi:hypothetical protein